MTFQHFFQGLGVFNMLHMVVGGVLGCAVYAQGLAYYVPDNLGTLRIGNRSRVVQQQSVQSRSLHGRIYQSDDGSEHQADLWLGAYACIFLFLLLLPL